MGGAGYLQETESKVVRREMLATTAWMLLAFHTRAHVNVRGREAVVVQYCIVRYLGAAGSRALCSAVCFLAGSLFYHQTRDAFTYTLRLRTTMTASSAGVPRASSFALIICIISLVHRTLIVSSAPPASSLQVALHRRVLHPGASYVD